MLRLAGLSSSVGAERCAQKMSVQRNDSKLSKARKYLILREYIQGKVQFQSGIVYYKYHVKKVRMISTNILMCTIHTCSEHGPHGMAVGMGHVAGAALMGHITCTADSTITTI